jgi:hypothetical protein
MKIDNNKAEGNLIKVVRMRCRWLYLRIFSKRKP